MNKYQVSAFLKKSFVVEDWTAGTIFSIFIKVVGFGGFLWTAIAAAFDRGLGMKLDFVWGVVYMETIVVLTLAWVIERYVVIRPHKYAIFPDVSCKIIKKITDSVVSVRLENRKSMEDPYIVRCSEEIVESICKLFESMYGQTFRACIVRCFSIHSSSIPNGGGVDKDNTNVRIFVRDEESRKKSKEKDEKSRNQLNTISMNTAYSKAVSKGIFCCNDLYELYCSNGYSNTSFNFEDYGTPNTYLGRKSWKLPYISVVISPIWIREHTGCPGFFFGFLCVDSLCPDILDERRAESTVSMFSDALSALYYSVLSNKEILQEIKDDQKALAASIK